MTKRFVLKHELLLFLLLPSVVSLGFYLFGSLNEPGSDYRFLAFNLVLAWLPLVFAFWLTKVLTRKQWSSWEGIAASLLWLLFLPNSFYMVSDYIHLQQAVPSAALYDSVMLTCFVGTGMALGITSLYLVHQQLAKRISFKMTIYCLAVVLLLCSFAIYIGRDLRWNSWDVLFSPGWVLLDVSYTLLTPSDYPILLKTTLSFWTFLSTAYFCAWRGSRLLFGVSKTGRRTADV